ncbi:MAG: hypothetical protein ACLSH8_04050 [Zhenhengia sp.]|uniref:hypothetical protein n=1 Tax=Zhenhengia sp. TaxID=2944208 RepID=UPI003992CB05
MTNREERGFVLIPNKWFDKGISELGHTTFAVYVLIFLRRGYDGISYFTVSYLCQMLEIKCNSTASITKIKESLIILEKNGWLSYKGSPFSKEKLELTSDININEKIYALVNEPKKNFTKVYVDEVYKIMGQQVDNKEKRGMLTYLCCILYHINQTTQVCFPSISTLKKEAKISNDKTCIKYNDMLKRLEIITYKNIGIKVDRNGKYTNGMNVYARVGNESYIDDEIIKIRERDDYYEVKQEKTDLINRRRSIKQKINNLAKKQQVGDVCIKQQAEFERLEQDYKKACEETTKISQMEKEKKKLIQFPNTNNKKISEYDMTTSEGRENNIIKGIQEDCEGW